jgi:hypothetical protein
MWTTVVVVVVAGGRCLVVSLAMHLHLPLP